jgi:hypothetical protein
MAVIGGGTGIVVAWNSGDDCAADRLLSLQAQEGPFSSWQPDTGAVLSRSSGHELKALDVGVNVIGDGVTNGTQILSSASAPFLPSMTGLVIYVLGFGRRAVEAVISASQIRVSGPPLPAGVDRKFTLPLGASAYADGVVSSGNRLSSASAPFSPGLVGTRVSIRDIGTRVIDSFIDDESVTIDGPSIPDSSELRFNIAVLTEPVDSKLLTSTGKVIDSHRSPSSGSPLTVRWLIGRR